MKRKENKVKQNRALLVASAFLLCLCTGCGIQDKALEISLKPGEETVTDKDAGEGNANPGNADGDGTGNYEKTGDSGVGGYGNADGDGAGSYSNADNDKAGNADVGSTNIDAGSLNANEENANANMAGSSMESTNTASITGSNGQQGAEAASREADRIYVHVCGAVNNPGVVGLPEDSRAEAALSAAGGFREDAQTDYVNLAARVEDGQQLYFPTREEAEGMVRQDSQQGQQEGTVQVSLVNINTADTALLCTLPGIGEARAQDIINYREKHGAFQKKEDIMKVSGIKESAYEKLCDRIVIE